MVNLTYIHITHQAYPDSENSLLFLGIFKDKKLNQQQRTLDNTLNNRSVCCYEIGWIYWEKR